MVDKKICWICEEREANSGEHIFKQSLLRDLYRQVKFSRSNRLIKRAQSLDDPLSQEKGRVIQSIRSDEFKFMNSICSECNNTYSRSWDLQAEQFFGYLVKNWRGVSRSGIINLRLSNPGINKEGVRDLYRYFCKLLGCCIFTEEAEIPQLLKDIVQGKLIDSGFSIGIYMPLSPADYYCSNNLLVCDDLNRRASNQLNYDWQLVFYPYFFSLFCSSPLTQSDDFRWYGQSKEIKVNTIRGFGTE